MNQDGCDLSRRGFLGVVGVTATGITLASSEGAAAPRILETGRKKPQAVVYGAFLYPPTKTLDEAGYYSWPGSSFDAEGHHREYQAKIGEMARELDMNVHMGERALDTKEDVGRFIEEVKAAKPDGLLLIPFKKGHWPHVERIIEETKLPTVILATLGVLLVDHIAPMHKRSGVYLISSLENLEAVGNGLRMIRTAQRMRESLLVDLAKAEAKESRIPYLNTLLRTLPLERFYEQYERTVVTEEVRKLAKAYERHAKDIEEPTKDDILDAARAYFALKGLIQTEQADAMMMTCLPGLQRPHKHVPPCMGFMSLRDEGFPIGCQSDLNSTITLMLVQYLFNKPGFQQNASMETERNHYFGAHCTSPSRMNGPESRPEPYILRSHAEAGWGCVPRVLFKEGQEVTMALYKTGDKPQMIVYSGKIVCCPKMPPAGGCRTNIEMTIDDVKDVCDVKGMHQIIFYGNHAKQLRAFCILHGIEAMA
ncbi:MAG TPA: hypothetical protein PLI09_11220 [Candidatus Hydrogenedentes bacterium]|nr:hypothetical protein [Candidatus Hydrogenedentota bacterium]